ncbi:hypothetical protein K0M31_020307 [Melipona bicolor]|uniref:Uncharacterized protein n=1 Tax=Melipona bicolor TaxID=60889 RepID=A0AA40KQP0_9HYME|nr:hypothetical protein K0M31_020307 [Melipona bicolor]
MLGVRREITATKRETRSVGPRSSDSEKEGKENRVPREEVMLKDQSELNSSRVPRRHSRKIPTPCESSSTGNDAHDWLGTAPLYPHQWKHASSRGYRHRRPPYGRAKAACHARHATFPFLSARPPLRRSAPPQFLGIRAPPPLCCAAN